MKKKISRPKKCMKFVNLRLEGKRMKCENCIKLKREIRALKESLDIVSDHKLIRDLQKSIEQVRKGRVICLKCIRCKKKIVKGEVKK